MKTVANNIITSSINTELKYKEIHKFHNFTGKSTELEAHVWLLFTGVSDDYA